MGKSKKKNTNIGCGFLLPRTTILLVISMLVLATNNILVFLLITEIADPISFRWGMCGLALALSGVYIIWALFLTRTIHRSVNEKKHSSQSSVYSFTRCKELTHAWQGIICLLPMAIFWAIFMGVKHDADFFITVNVKNYVTLKIFYVVDIVVTTFLLATVLPNFVDDATDHKITQLENKLQA